MIRNVITMNEMWTHNILRDLSNAFEKETLYNNKYGLEDSVAATD